MPKIASTCGFSKAPTSTSSFAPPGRVSSLCWKISLTVPAKSSLCLQSSFAVPSSIATCMSCPQACIMPGSSLLYGSPVSSVTGSASISARNATHLPDPLPPWISPMTAVGTGDWISSTPSSASFSRISFEVRNSFRPISGCRWMVRRIWVISSCSCKASSYKRICFASCLMASHS